MQAAERVVEAGGEQRVELAALLVGKAGVTAVRPGILQVDLVVRHVEVAAHHDRFRRRHFASGRLRQPLGAHVPRAHLQRRHFNVRASLALADAGVGGKHDEPVRIRTLDRDAFGQHALLKPLAELPECVVPLHAVIDARQLVLRIWRVDAHEPKIGELAGHDAPLVIEVREPQAVQHLQGHILREHRGARIPLALSVAPKLVIAGQIRRRLTRLQLGFLQREHVGIELPHDILEALLQNGAQAVDVPRHESHCRSFAPI